MSAEQALTWSLPSKTISFNKFPWPNILVEGVVDLSLYETLKVILK